MKKTTLLSLTFLLISNCFCQKNGVVNYTISNNCVKKIESSKSLPKSTREQWVYVYGGMKEYVQKAVLKFNVSECHFDYKEDEDSKWRKEDGYITYRDREKNIGS